MSPSIKGCWSNAERRFWYRVVRRLPATISHTFAQRSWKSSRPWMIENGLPKPQRLSWRRLFFADTWK